MNLTTTLRILVDMMSTAGPSAVWTDAADRVRHGAKLSDALSDTNALPAMAVLRTALRVRARLGRKDSWIYAVSCMVGKHPECHGALAYLLGSRRGSRRGA